MQYEYRFWGLRIIGFISDNNSPQLADCGSWEALHIFTKCTRDIISLAIIVTKLDWKFYSTSKIVASSDKRKGVADQFRQ